MLNFAFSGTEVEIIQRAFAIALESGKMPDPKDRGDEVRIACVRKQLDAAMERHKADTWRGRRG